MKTFDRPSHARQARRACAALLVVFLAAETCHACRLPPQVQRIGVDEQIALAVDVSVARVIRASAMADGQMEYEFEVQKRIFGPDRERFTIVGSTNTVDDPRKDFDKHTAEAFWRHGGGRLMNWPDCVIRPWFIVGASYLAFVGQPITRRSFERIDTYGGDADASDKWLAYVESALRDARLPR